MSATLAPSRTKYRPSALHSERACRLGGSTASSRSRNRRSHRVRPEEVSASGVPQREQYRGAVMPGAGARGAAASMSDDDWGVGDGGVSNGRCLASGSGGLAKFELTGQAPMGEAGIDRADQQDNHNHLEDDAPDDRGWVQQR